MQVHVHVLLGSSIVSSLGKNFSSSLVPRLYRVQAIGLGTRLRTSVQLAIGARSQPGLTVVQLVSYDNQEGHAGAKAVDGDADFSHALHRRPPHGSNDVLVCPHLPVLRCVGQDEESQHDEHKQDLRQQTTPSHHARLKYHNTIRRHIHVHAFQCLYRYMYVYVGAARTYTCTHTRTYTHTHTHTHTLTTT